MNSSSVATFVPGPAFDVADLRLYAHMTRRLGFAPTRQMLDCLPDAGPLQALRHDPDEWARFRTAVPALSADIPAWTTTVAEDGTKLGSVPERIVYDSLIELRPDDVVVDPHPETVGYKADFALRRGSAVVYIEVLGMLERDRPPCNAEAERYRLKTDRKLLKYAAHGVRPVLIFLDDICDPPRLRDLLRQAFGHLGGRGGVMAAAAALPGQCGKGDR